MCDAPQEACSIADTISNSDELQKQIVLSVCWSEGKLGGAFYDVSTFQVYAMDDAIERAPDFLILRTLFKELDPRILIVGGRQDHRLYSVIQELCRNEASLSNKVGSELKQQNEGSSSNIEGNISKESVYDNTTSASVQSETSLYVLPSSDFKYEVCRRRILIYPWPGLMMDASEIERSVWVRAVIDIDEVAVVRALGGLLREDLVHLDEATMTCLQVFSEDLHPASFKSGKASASKEGLSLFALLSRTASPVSSNVLRRVIQRPIRDPNVLMTRYDFITWATQPVNLDTVRSLQSCLKNISNVQMLLSRLGIRQLKVSDWKTLYKSLYFTVLFAEICKSQDQRIQAFRKVCECTCKGLYNATYLIQRTLNFEEAQREGRFVVRPGLDSELDNKKRQFHVLADLMLKVAEFELANLPPEIPSCCIIYVPHVGYLLAIPPSALNSPSPTGVSGSENEDSSKYNIPGLQYRFCTADMVLFKSGLCSELDNQLGDLQVDIANHETSVMIRLIEDILDQVQSFVELVNNALMIDVLLSFSMTALDFGWVRPEMNSEGRFIVKGGRHPLYELCSPTFVANDISGGVYDAPVTLVTGPNASGKTVYVKQVGIISYLAHLGCFVPAESLSFQPLHSITAVALMNPSVTSGFSLFMVELNRLSVAVARSTKNSLVLVDEFGISTYEYDGASLLAAVINFWTEQLDDTASASAYKGCPMVFLSTHFLGLYDFLSRKNRIKNLSMEVIEEDGRLIPLYQAVHCQTQKTYALKVAQATSLPPQIVERAFQVRETLLQNFVPPKWSAFENERELQLCQDVANLFFSYDLRAESVQNLLVLLREFLWS